MTWYADHLFAEPYRPLLDRWLADPLLARHVFLIKDLAGFHWHDPAVKHDLGANGLAIARPICAPHSHRAEWYGHDFVSWLDLDLAEATDLDIQPSRLHEDDSDTYLDDFPPAAFLKYVKHLSKDHQVTLAFYHCSMWGGDTDIEYAWIFKAGAELAYSGSHFRDSPNIITEYRPDATKTETQGFVLVKTLAHFSIDLPTPFFAPHTRGFPWEAKRITGMKAA